MKKNMIISLVSQTIVGALVLISTIIFFYGSTSTGRSNPFGLMEIVYSVLMFLIFSCVYFFIGTKLEIQAKKFRNILSISLPVILFIILFAGYFIFNRGVSHDLAHSVYDFVLYTFGYNYCYPFVDVFKFFGPVFGIITAFFPFIFMFLGMEIKQKG